MPPQPEIEDDDEIDSTVTLKAKIYEWECPVCEVWNDEEDNGRDSVMCGRCHSTFAVGQIVHKGE